MKKTIFALFLAAAFSANAQTLEKRGTFYSILKGETGDMSGKRLETGSTVSSVVLETSKSTDLDGLFIWADGVKYPIRWEDCGEPGALGAKSGMVVFPKPVLFFEIRGGDPSKKIKLWAHLFNVPSLDLNLPSNSKETFACLQPESIDQSVWRAGLPAPAAAPSCTKAEHLIVHHAAGSNTAVNYTDVVRNIYIYHTQSNGWNDVGYNFLIAQNGVIYDGRDGRNLCPDDEVMGAHLCAKNAGTMGVCMLGDYQTGRPTDAAILSLEKLLAWKADKMKLDVMSKSDHPAGSGVMLANLAGHRDGCSTTCPGENLYSRMAEIREKSAKCLTTASEEEFIKQEPLLYPNPASSFTKLQGADLKGVWALISAEGRNFTDRAKWQDDFLNVSDLPEGLYVLRFWAGGNQKTVKLWIKKQ